MQPYRIPLIGFPDVVLHAEESAVKKHPSYAAAKGGNDLSAYGLTADLIDWTSLGPQGRLGAMIDAKDIELVPVHALESEGINEIPMAMANLMAADMELTVNSSIVQLNTVGHTGASGFQRLANQACFAGTVIPGRRYLIVDDFVGQGGTLANIIGFIAACGGHVVGATALTGKAFSAKLAPDESLIQALRLKHGSELEHWWEKTFGFGFDCLTQSEARYLEKSADAQTIRDRLAEAGLASGSGASS